MSEPLVIPELGAPERGDMLHFVHALIVSMLDGRRACLQAEPPRDVEGDGPVAWTIRRGSESAQLAASSPSFGAFRSALAAFGRFYLDGEVYGGFRAGELRYRDEPFFYTAYMSNNNYEMAGFWIRVDVKPLGRR